MSKKTNEQALDLLVDLIDPVIEVLTDETYLAQIKEGVNALKALGDAIKAHREAVIRALALLEGVPVEEYTLDLGKLALDLVKLAGSPAMKAVLEERKRQEN